MRLYTGCGKAYVKLKLIYFLQQSTAGSRGGDWGWDDEHDEDMSIIDVPEVDYKVSPLFCYMFRTS